MSDNQTQDWRGPVSWAQMFIGLSSVALVLLASLYHVLDRITRLEERQLSSAIRLTEQEIIFSKSQLLRDSELLRLRQDIVTKMDSIGADVVVIKIQLAGARNQIKNGARP